tara:strand:+ start:205 stop:468 length:264 start_codon:yes stop_codon:yes gene_type:complete
MPKYYYKCLNEECDQIFEFVHSMKEKLKVCLYCPSSVERIPLNKVNLIKNNKAQEKQKTGSLVKKSIEEFKQDLKDEKKRLREKEYK